MVHINIIVQNVNIFMMNKLEEYRDQKADEYGSSPMDYNHIDDGENDFKNGFDAAIGLDLPVKFAEWRDKNPFNMKTRELHLEITKHYGHKPSIKELYQYWLDNVYKPE